MSARSVKLLERITNLEEPESRDTWWSEIRMEIRSHARALNCNAVLGYTETTSIWYLITLGFLTLVHVHVVTKNLNVYIIIIIVRTSRGG